MAQAESCTFHIHLHAIHVSGCFSLTRPSPLSTSSPSSCPSSFPSSSTSTTSCNQSSTRRTLKTCATPRRTRVRTLMTSSTLPHEEKLSFSSHAGRNASSFAQLVSPCAPLRTSFSPHAGFSGTASIQSASLRTSWFPTCPHVGRLAGFASWPRHERRS